ncbi:MAG TPA: glycoside hydrolase family 15 protein [Anaeromyxobacteraceae bacterium]|nr:glycoside hydrolase family 15 protein [Anaeromyxobacteraceae bacterium]
MALRIEDYALLGDTQSAALVGNDGSVDWLCFPRFDSDACFAALLGGVEHGRWLLAPAGPVRRVRRAYRDETLVLDTDFEVDGGVLRVTDCMPPRGAEPDLVRVAECTAGRVAVQLELRPRFGYGATAPWIMPGPGGARIIGGPDALRLTGDVPVELERERVTARFELDRGSRAAFVLDWHPSHEKAPPAIDPASAVRGAEEYWRTWSQRCRYEGRWRDAVIRSIITLKALTYAPTGGLLAAATTSLPEKIGGVRNWDYRYCWVRDATFTLYALLVAGYTDEARAWRDWLLRAAAGHPSELQIMYGVGGERRLPELELPWLPGYEGSRPVRIGNAAAEQLQLDVIGELMDCLHQARRSGIDPTPAAWDLQRALVEHLESTWQEPDEGIWEVRSGRHPFTHSRVMAWVAVDRAVSAVERLGMEGPLERWKALRNTIHDQVCRQGFDADRGAFVQAYGSRELDASLLMIPMVGFLPPDDPRVRGTVEAIQRELCEGGLVLRYRSESTMDGLPPGEGAFLPCTFWLADCLALMGRVAEARALVKKLLALRNDVGLLSEEYDVHSRRLVGNFPQAFSHVALVNAVRNVSRPGGPAEARHRE